MAESWHRWIVKKTARKAVVLGSLASGSLAVRRIAEKPCVRVITYHRFGYARHDQYCIAPDAFDAQMRWLSQQRLALSLEDLLRYIRGEAHAANGSVLVTIDDGFSSALSVAAPILRRYGIPAVAYLATRAIANPDAGRGAGEAYLDWQQVAELSAGGVTIGSHSHTHRSMARLDLGQVRDEGKRSKELIETRLGREVTSFAYPYGMRRDESSATMKALAECGYRSIFISQHGVVRRSANPLRLPRIKVEAAEPLWMFQQLCRGGMDAWNLVDRIL